MKYASKNSNGNKMVKKTLKHFTAIKMLKEMEENAEKNVSWNPKSQREKSCQIEKKNLTFNTVRISVISVAASFFLKRGEGCRSAYK